MPYVNVRVTKSGLTRERKAKIVGGITSLLEEVLGKRPEHTHVVIDAIEEEDWGFAGMLTDEYRSQDNR